jgi:hypothetical protein
MSEKKREASDIFAAKEDTLSQAYHEGLPAPGSRERLLAEGKLVHKLDMRLIPTIFIIFIMNYIDVSSLSFSSYKRSCSSCFDSAVALQLHG